MTVETQPVRPARKRKAKPLWKRGIIYVSAMVIAVYSGFPIFYMVISSIKAPEELVRKPTIFARRYALDSYDILLQLTDYPTQFLNSVIVAMVTVMITLVLSVLIAYSVTRYRIKGKTLIVSAMLYAYMFPPLLLAIPLYSIFAVLGMADTMLSLSIAHLTLTLPLGVWFLWGFFKQLPFELEEAAMVDGCSRLGAFFRIVLPLSMPGLITVCIFSFLLSWTDYTFALIMIASDANKTLPVGLASMMGSYELRWGELMAGATLIALPLFVIFTFLNKYFVAGMTAGAMKG